MFLNRLRTLQLVGYAEATSFLLLLGVAMPLKYLAGWPLGVTVVGMAHGVLWILYLMAAGWAGTAYRWGWREFLGAGLASVLPGGPFVFDAWVIRRATSTPEQADYGEPGALATGARMDEDTGR